MLVTFYQNLLLLFSEVAQSCLTLCDPMDCSLPSSSVHGIFGEIVLEWISISFSRGSSRPRDRTWVPRIVDRRFTIWATREVLLLFNATTNNTALLKGEKSRTNAGRNGISQKLYVRMFVCTQSCQTVCDPMEYSLPGSSVHGIISVRILEWVAIFSFRGSSWPGINLVSLASSPLAGGCFTTMPPGKPKQEQALANFLVWERNPGNETLSFVSQFLQRVRSCHRAQLSSTS